MRRHLALAVGAMFIVLSSTTHSDAEQQKQPGTITSDQKALCDWFLNECISNCYETGGTAGELTRYCTTNCTRLYRRCKKTGKL